MSSDAFFSPGTSTKGWPQQKSPHCFLIISLSHSLHHLAHYSHSHLLLHSLTPCSHTTPLYVTPIHFLQKLHNILYSQCFSSLYLNTLTCSLTNTPPNVLLHCWMSSKETGMLINLWSVLEKLQPVSTNSDALVISLVSKLAGGRHTGWIHAFSGGKNTVQYNTNICKGCLHFRLL